LALRAGIGTVSPNLPPLNTRLAHVLTLFRRAIALRLSAPPQVICVLIFRENGAKSAVASF
jgi:hypothetical protein